MTYKNPIALLQRIRYENPKADEQRRRELFIAECQAEPGAVINFCFEWASGRPIVIEANRFAATSQPSGASTVTDPKPQ